MVYPNPVKEILTIATDSHINDLAITSLQGIAYPAERVGENKWNVERLHAGLYIATIRINGKKYFVKVVKQ